MNPLFSRRIQTCVCVLLLVIMPITAQEAHFTQSMKQAYDKYFMIGVAVNQRNISQPEQIALLCKEFNSITAENDMKPGPTHPTEEQYRWERADAIANFCRENGIKLRGHCLMWHNQTCQWMYEDQPSKELLLARMRKHIHTVVTRYKDVVYAWDVVNEAITDDEKASDPYRPSKFYKIAGEDFIFKAFEYAREADPDALLFYNDYNECNPIKCQRIVDMVKRMKKAGVPIDGIGMQGHYNIYGPTEEALEQAIKAYRKVVKHIHVTELDIRVTDEMGGALRFKREGMQISDSTEQFLADQYARVFRVLRKYHKNIDCVTFWNLSDNDSWLGVRNYATPFDADYQPKRAYEYIVEKKAPLWPQPKRPKK